MRRKRMHGHRRSPFRHVNEAGGHEKTEGSKQQIIEDESTVAGKVQVNASDQVNLESPLEQPPSGLTETSGTPAVNEKPSRFSSGLSSSLSSLSGQQEGANTGVDPRPKRGERRADKGWTERTLSDRRLKKNITLIGKSESGINIYSFEYKNSIYGKGVYQGVISDEIPQEAIIKNSTGYDMVDYNQLDVDFIKI